MKTYILRFQDKEKNDLCVKEDQFINIKAARQYAKLLFANSCMNDLHRIKVELKKNY